MGIKETDKNNLNNIDSKQKAQNYVPPLSGKSISNPNIKQQQQTNVPNKSFSFTFGQKQKQQNNQCKMGTNPQQKLAKIRQQLHNLNIAHSDSTNSSKKSNPQKAAKHKKKRRKKKRAK